MKASPVSVVTKLLANMPKADGPRKSRSPATLIRRNTTNTGKPAKVSRITVPKMPVSVMYQGRLSNLGLRARGRFVRGTDEPRELAREMDGGAAQAVDDGCKQPPLW